uniref:Uncharacterized protein n=1 Tax=Vespula pensylvanica TaxID=30213 RepID=A0A834U9I9_VESPE|nr:hypothetical protein H0235_008917 [Vespula pensylvanica]
MLRTLEDLVISTNGVETYAFVRISVERDGSWVDRVGEGENSLLPPPLPHELLDGGKRTREEKRREEKRREEKRRDETEKKRKRNFEEEDTEDSKGVVEEEEKGWLGIESKE